MLFTRSFHGAAKAQFQPVVPRSRVGRAMASVALVAAGSFGCESLDALTIRYAGAGQGADIENDAANDMPIESATWLDDTSGHVTFHMDGKLYRASAQPGAPIEDLDARLDGFSRGSDIAAGVSPDGRWMVIQSSRELCREWAVQAADEEPWSCLVTAQFGDQTELLPDGSIKRQVGVFGIASVQPVRIGGAVRLHDASVPSINSGGTLIVFSASAGSSSRGVKFEGPEGQTHLYAITRAQGQNAWSQPRALTLDSPYPYHSYPVLSPDGTKVLTDCHHDLDIVLPRAICEVLVHGSGVRELVRPEDGRVDGRPSGMGGANHHARYAPDGTIVFESDWPVWADNQWGPCEAVWRLDPATSELSRVSAEQCNDNTPCALPDGRVISLWLPRKGHEVKAFDPKTANFYILTPGRDATDVTLSCSQ